MSHVVGSQFQFTNSVYQEKQGSSRLTRPIADVHCDGREPKRERRLIMAGEICGKCGEPIEGPKIMGQEVDYVVIDGKRVLVHSDCLFDDVPDGIIAGRVIPRGGCGPID